MKRTRMFRAALERYLVSRILLQGKIVLQQVTIRPLVDKRKTARQPVAGKQGTGAGDTDTPVTWELASLAPRQPAAVMDEVIRPIIAELQVAIDLTSEDEAGEGGTGNSGGFGPKTGGPDTGGVGAGGPSYVAASA